MAAATQRGRPKRGQQSPLWPCCLAVALGKSRAGRNGGLLAVVEGSVSRGAVRVGVHCVCRGLWTHVAL